MSDYLYFRDRITEAARLDTLEARARRGCEIHQQMKHSKELTDNGRRDLKERIYTDLLDMAPETAYQAAFGGISDEQAINDRMELRGTSKGAYLKAVQDAYNYTLNNMPQKENPVNVKSICTRVKAGYVGQITVNGTIVWESTPKKTAVKALAAADKHFDKVTTRLFA